MEKSDNIVDVIILNWNGVALLQRYLPEVLANTSQRLARVVVADNGSTDASLELLERDFPDVEVWRFDENYGFAGGYNRCLEMSRKPYCVLLNSDVAPQPGWIAPLVEYMESHPKTAACQPKILSDLNPTRFEYAGAAGGMVDRHGYPYCRGRIFDTCEVDRGQYDDPREVFWASGAAMMVRRDVYLALGGLDSEFFAHMEEIDLCWRMQLAGYKVAAVPASVVRHLGGGSLAANNPRKTYLNFRNNLLMLHKNLPEQAARKLIPLRMVLDGVAAGMFALKGKFAHVKSIWRAHRDFRRMRRAYQPEAQVNMLDATPDSRRSILWQHYLRGRRAYSRLK